MTGLSMGSEQVKERKHKNPDEIDKVPEKSADLDTIGQVLGIALVKPLAYWQPHINEHQHATEHVQTMQAGDGKIARKIRAVSWLKHRRVLHVLFFNRGDLFRRGLRPEMRPIHLGVRWVCVERIQR